MPELNDFTALERCDRCNAQAYLELAIPGGKATLLFCIHHYRENLPGLMRAGALMVRDGRLVSH